MTSEFFKYASENPGQTLALLGSILAIFAGYIVSYNQQKQQIQDKNDIIQAQQNVIEEQRNIVLGGDSRLYLSPFLKNNELGLKFELDGQYPVYDASISLESWTLRDRRPLLWEKDPGVQFFNIGTVQKMKTLELFREIPLTQDGSVEGKKIFLKISSRNAVIEEDIIAYRIGDQSGLGYKVIMHTPKYNERTYGMLPFTSRRLIKSLSNSFRLDLIPDQDRPGDSGWDKPTENDNTFNL